MQYEPRRGDTRILVEVGCTTCVRMECRPYGTGWVEPDPGPTAGAVGYGLSSLRDCATGIDKTTSAS